jgi:succinate dehydrogenase/fumarate reductase flavoprotein subunit
LINECGENLAEKAGLGDLNRAIRTDRDRLSAFLYREGTEGTVAMDYTQVPDAAWHAYPLAMLSRMRFDFRHRPVPVSPGAHFCMGGVDIDRDAQTSLSGLYACGEVVGGMHGANRRGGNALTECVVFGHLAGKRAAKSAAQRVPHRGIATISAPPLSPSGTGKKRRYRDWSRRLQTIAWRRAGVVRSRGQLKKGGGELEQWRKELEENPPATVTEARMHDLLSGGALVLEAVLTASLEREESRGAFLREDFPCTDDVNWRRNSRIRLDRTSQQLLLEFVPAG